MLEKILKLLRPKPEPIHRCVWKAVYLNYTLQTKSKISREALDEVYKKIIGDCVDCSGYESKRSCHYTRKN